MVAHALFSPGLGCLAKPPRRVLAGGALQAIPAYSQLAGVSVTAAGQTFQEDVSAEEFLHKVAAVTFSFLGRICLYTKQQTSSNLTNKSQMSHLHLRTQRPESSLGQNGYREDMAC